MTEGAQICETDHMTTNHLISGQFRVLMIVGFTALSLTACTQIPELDQAVPESVRKADFPKLVALDTSLTASTLPQDESEKIAQAMAARRDQLNRRAERLNKPVIDSQTKTRMEDGVSG